jgi:hypothetical protein
MALLFFEGFNRSFDGQDPTPISAGNWALTPVTAGSSTYTPQFGHTSTKRNGSGSLYLPTNNGGSNSTQCYAEWSVGAHADKVLYLGFAGYNFYTGYNDAPTVSPFPATLLRVYSSNSVERFRIDLEINTTIANALNVTIKNASGTTLGSFIYNDIYENPSYPPSRSFGRDKVYSTTYETKWGYFEVKITTGATVNNVEVRANGIALQTSGGQTVISIPVVTPTNNVGKIRFYANETADQYIDDLYLLDDSGSSLNSWLGPTVAIYSPDLVSTNDDVSTATTQEWTAVGTLSLGSHNPDSDYLTTKLPNKSQLYVLDSADSLFSMPEENTVAAVQIRSTARETSLPSAYQQVFKPNTAGATTAVVTVTTNAYYESTNTVLVNDPSTTTGWTLTGLETAHFGIKSVVR